MSTSNLARAHRRAGTLARGGCRRFSKPGKGMDPYPSGYTVIRSGSSWFSPDLPERAQRAGRSTALEQVWFSLDPCGSCENGGGGIRTHGGFHLAGFQDRSHQPLDHPSRWRARQGGTYPCSHAALRMDSLWVQASLSPPSLMIPRKPPASSVSEAGQIRLCPPAANG